MSKMNFKGFLNGDNQVTSIYNPLNATLTVQKQDPPQVGVWDIISDTDMFDVNDQATHYSYANTGKSYCVQPTGAFILELRGFDADKNLTDDIFLNGVFETNDFR